jgi:type IV pilus assembly protein PilC
MSLFSYTAVGTDGRTRQGTIDAVNVDVAIVALQRRGLTLTGIEPVKQANALASRITSPFDRVTNRDVVLLSRQINTLFEAQVSALRAFRLLATEARTPQLAEKLTQIGNDIQSGSTISAALAKQPEVFSDFYVNMVRAGEEAGKLDETFNFLADYLDRNYEISQKAKNALVYPAFVMFTFVSVMVLMLTMVIPRLSSILLETNQNIPVYTKIVIGMSTFVSKYIVLLGIVVLVAGGTLWRYSTTDKGQTAFAQLRLRIPSIGGIYQKLFLSRIADNASTMLRSGIQMVRALEVTSTVVGDKVYADILASTVKDVEGGMPVSDALRKHSEIPGIFVAMIKIGEETGDLSKILDTLAKFYRRDVSNSIDTLVGLIEPFMIVTLAIGVAFLLASVLIPIYNVASGI